MDLSPFADRIEALRRRLAALARTDGAAGTAAGAAREESIAIVGTALDTVVAAHASFSEEANRYRNLFEHAPDGYLVTDAHGTIREANVAIASMLKIANGWVAGEPLARFLAEPARRELGAIVQSLQTGTETRYWEVRLFPRDGGAPLDADLSISAIRATDGSTIGLRWLVRDVSARKRAEAQLTALFDTHEERLSAQTSRLEAEIHLQEQSVVRERTVRAEAEFALRGTRDLLDGIGVVVYEADAASGRFTYVSRFCEALLGHAHATWLETDRFWLDFVHSDDREHVAAERRRGVLEGRAHEIDYRGVASDGRVVWLRDIANVVCDPLGRPQRLRGVICNINRRKRIERKLHYRRHDVESHLLDMSHLHELGMRLAAHIGEPAALGEVLHALTALHGTERGAVLRLDPGTESLEVAATHGASGPGFAGFAAALLSTAARMLASDRKGIVVSDLAADPRFTASGERAREFGVRAFHLVPVFGRAGDLQGALAAFFGEPHHPRDRQLHLVELYAEQAAPFIEHAFRLDTPSALQRTESDDRLDRSHERNAIAAVESGHALRPRAARRALVVDDDPPTARTLARLLKIWGFEVGVAENGADAIADAGRHPPDVALIDIGLPGIDGHEVARLLRHQIPHPLLLLAVTGYSHPNDLRQAAEAGFDHYLIKPVDLDQLGIYLSRIGVGPAIEAMRARE
jgi:PAS domain S-box-containing protein